MLFRSLLARESTLDVLGALVDDSVRKVGDRLGRFPHLAALCAKEFRDGPSRLEDSGVHAALSVVESNGEGDWGIVVDLESTNVDPERHRGERGEGKGEEEGLEVRPSALQEDR